MLFSKLALLVAAGCIGYLLVHFGMKAAVWWCASRKVIQITTVGAIASVFLFRALEDVVEEYHIQRFELPYAVDSVVAYIILMIFAIGVVTALWKIKW
ncbi:MAG: hypothetical protein Q7S05_00685 [bacterium]|nr:hypothetical protein [bacterium]